VCPRSVLQICSVENGDERNSIDVKHMISQQEQAKQSKFREFASGCHTSELARGLCPLEQDELRCGCSRLLRMPWTI
jgi:hypothetical protein